VLALFEGTRERANGPVWLKNDFSKRMKTQLQPYLFFGGRCEEAIEFYQKALGARVDYVMYHRDSPDPHPPGMLQPGFEDKVMHTTIRIGEAVFMASDGCDDRVKFEGFRMSLELETEDEVQRAFGALAEGGQVDMPPVKTFWSKCFGMVTDRFGLGWMLMVPPEAPEN
jgi:PhnB protein